MPKVVAIIQAHMGSTRLPGKVMMPMAGKPMLQRVIERVKLAKTVDEIVVAVPQSSDWMAMSGVCKTAGAECFLGTCNEDDVLLRFCQAATTFDADTIVRICADSPLMDPKHIDDVVEAMNDESCQFAAFVMPDGTHAIRTKRGTYPEAITARLLRFIERHTPEPEKREHVTSEAYDSLLARYELKADDDGINRAVDTQEDFDRVEQMIIEEETTNANDRTAEREAVGA